MDTKKFEVIVDEQMDTCRNILVNKAKEYATEDRLHNFKVAAELQCTGCKEALAGMMAKHTVSVYDMCRDGKSHTMAQWNEKITDHINYLLLLKAVVTEEIEFDRAILYADNMTVDLDSSHK
jgi:hypothetical protein